MSMFMCKAFVDVDVAVLPAESTRMKMIVMSIIMRVPVFMNDGKMSMKMRVVFGDKEVYSGKHAAECDGKC